MKTKTNIIYAEEFEDDVYLDVLSLGKEVFIQPTMYEKYSRYVSNLENERDDLIQKMEQHTDTMDLEIRAIPESFGLSEIKEKAVKAVINLDETTQVFTRDLRFLNNLIKEAKGALRAIEIKGQSLKQAVQMYVTGYWGELSAIPRKMQEDIDAYLDSKDMAATLENDDRLLRRAKNGQKEK